MAPAVKRIGRDRFRVRLGAEEIALLRNLPDQLRSVLVQPEPGPERSGEPRGGVPPARGGAMIGQEPTPEGAPEAAPVDPVLERLFPRAYLEPEDVDRDAEYRRLVRDDLLQEKLANLDVVTSTIERGAMSMRRWTVDLSEDEAVAWLGALNDLRLALGVRLGITEDFDGDVDPSDPRAPGLYVLSYLGWLEEHLVEALASA